MSLPTNPSQSFIKRNPHLYPQSRPAGYECNIYPPKEEPVKKQRIRQSSKPLLNKLETEWLSRMNARWTGCYTFHPQAIRFKLGNGIWYKPDFVCFTWMTNSVAVWEVKGPHAFRGGFENLKVLKHQYPHIQVYLTWKDKEDGQWKEQLVLP